MRYTLHTTMYHTSNPLLIPAAAFVDVCSEPLFPPRMQALGMVKYIRVRFPDQE